MKNILKNILFWNDAPNGAVFGITFYALGNWFNFLIFHAFFYSDIVKFSFNLAERIVWLVIISYSLFLIFRFFYCFCHANYRKWWARNIWIIPCISLVIFSLLYFIVEIFFTLIFLILGITLIFSLAKKVKIRWLCTLFFTTVLGSFALGYAFDGFIKFASCFTIYFENRSCYGSLPFYNTNTPWFLIFILSLILLLISYIIFAKILANISDKSFFKIFNLPTKILWLILILSYIFNFFMIAYQQKRIEITQSQLEKRFNHVLTAQGLKDAMYKNEAPNKLFWENIEEKSRQLIDKLNKNNYYFIFTYYPKNIPKDIQEEWHLLCKKNKDYFTNIDKLLATQLPPRFENFNDGKVIDNALTKLNFLKKLALIIRFRLEIAIQDKNKEEIKKYLKQFKNLNNKLSKEFSMIGGLLSIACKNIYLSGVVELINSQVLSEHELEQIKNDIQSLEKQLKQVHENSLYAETVLNVDIMRSLDNISAFTSKEYPIKYFRWVFPQFWWQFLVIKNKLLNRFNIFDLTYYENILPKDKILYKGNILNLKKAGERFYISSAKIKLLLSAIEAEKIRRKTGKFPENLKMPIDPLSQTPLNYNKGEFKHKEYFVEKGLNSFIKENTKIVKQKGVLLWSNGINKIDESSKYNEKSDDIKIILKDN